MDLTEFQILIDRTYGEKDRARGLAATWLWFSEEVGELARAVNGRTDAENLRTEFADVLAWLTTLASMSEVDLEAAAKARYGKGCPRCHAIPCRCIEAEQRPVASGGKAASFMRATAGETDGETERAKGPVPGPEEEGSAHRHHEDS